MPRTITLRLSDDLAADLALLARLDGVSGAEATRVALTLYLDERLSDDALRARLESAHEAERRLLQRSDGG